MLLQWISRAFEQRAIAGIFCQLSNEPHHFSYVKVRLSEK
jgi:hypothetical protein